VQYAVARVSHVSPSPAGVRCLMSCCRVACRIDMWSLPSPISRCPLYRMTCRDPCPLPAAPCTCPRIPCTGSEPPPRPRPRPRRISSHTTRPARGLGSLVARRSSSGWMTDGRWHHYHHPPLPPPATTTATAARHQAGRGHRGNQAHHANAHLWHFASFPSSALPPSSSPSIDHRPSGQ
jgi:hypothetical protein